MLQEFGQQMGAQGLSLDLYYQITGTTEDDLRQRMRPDAEQRVREKLALEKIMELEQIEATEEEVEREIEEIARQHNQEPEKIKEIVEKNNASIFSENVVLRKTIDFLVEHATIKEKPTEQDTEETSEAETDDEAETQQQ